METARRCGLVINSRTLMRSEVEASCPFCGDRGKGKHHLSLNTEADLYRCNLCGASGNSVSLYARIHHIDNKQAFLELERGGNIYPIPVQLDSRNTERQPLPLRERHAAYTEMLSCLTLTPRHRDNLLERGLSRKRIEENEYRSLPHTPQGRRLLAELVGASHTLLGIPGFYLQNDCWTIAAPSGMLIPVRDKEGLIQGLKIRLDDKSGRGRKYRWFSSRDKSLTAGTRSYSWIHVTGDRSRKRAFLTEGPLKGDVASFLAKDALFICTGGVNAIGGLKDAIRELKVTEVVEAMDMDQMSNPQVQRAVLAMRREVQSIPKLKYTKYTWNPACKGVDDYLLNRIVAG